MAANRRIIIAMSMLLVAIFASVSVTFAWFSSGTLASAIFSLTTRSNKDHLYIQVEETELAKERTDDFSQSIVQLRDLTYAKGEGGRWGLYREDGRAAEGADYILHSYTFYTDNPQKTVYLMRSESDVRSDYMVRHFTGADKTYWLREGKSNENIAKFYGTTDVSMTNDFASTVVWRRGEPGETVYYFNSRSGSYATSASNAARIMFFEGVHSALPDRQSSIIWEPNAGEGYDAVNSDGSNKYEQVSSYYRNVNQLGANDAVGRDAPGNTVYYSVISGDAQLFATSAWRQVAAGDADYHADMRLFRCSVTLAMWIEGRDADCFNVIIRDIINADFSFQLV